MYVCVCVYIYIYLCNTQKLTYTRAHRQMLTDRPPASCAHPNAGPLLHTYRSTYIHTYIQEYIHTDHTYIHTYVHTYIHTYIHIIHNIHTYIRTYIRTYRSYIQIIHTYIPICIRAHRQMQTDRPPASCAHPSAGPLFPSTKTCTSAHCSPPSLSSLAWSS